MNYAERGEYGRVPQGDGKSSCCNCLKTCFGCLCSKFGCFLCGVILVLFMVPQNPVWSFGNDRLRDIIQYEASAVTGVQVSVGSVEMGLWNAQTDIYNFSIGNPKGYDAMPFFMHCDKVHSDFSWLQFFTSFAYFTEVEELTLEGLEVYIEQRFGVESNLNEILTNVAKSPLGKIGEHMLYDKQHKYQIDKIKVAGMKVHVRMTAMPVAEVYVPPMFVNGIGVKQKGVTLEQLIGLLVQALSVSALAAEDEQVKINILKTVHGLEVQDQTKLQTIMHLNKNDKNGQKTV